MLCEFRTNQLKTMRTGRCEEVLTDIWWKSWVGMTMVLVVVCGQQPMLAASVTCVKACRSLSRTVYEHMNKKDIYSKLLWRISECERLCGTGQWRDWQTVRCKSASVSVDMRHASCDLLVTSSFSQQTSLNWYCFHCIVVQTESTC